ncbi:substrate-binding domain-containing protein [Actinoallomurus rhizosphaericola]|uniref:substrate-binding domain-containing protein n=1 Tax=Actinoallomurus rhizosphaericola TaxID=2952536 RepID=UPI00209186F8|nr:substrate-binding domain-containing protein [Actinoallomurus rhizosphaericola]MCO5993290.1 substrate-binding domain-containing protein [Actinoallomurus rhizosphaericola]
MPTMIQAIAELIAQRQENVLLGLLIVLLVTSPLADRYLVRRRRITYRVLYNSKIGLSPVALHDVEDRSTVTDPRLREYARTFDRLSIVIIRVRNTGGYDIEPSDFTRPLSFTFKDRVIWNARISDASTDRLHDAVRDHLEFFATTNGNAVTGNGGPDVRTLRRLLADRLTGLVKSPAAGPPEDVRQWNGVRLTGLSLERRQRFKLVVVLREQDDPADGAISKKIEADGALTSGWVKDEKRQRRLGWPVAAIAAGVVLTLALTGNVVANYYQRRSDPALHCASGHLRLEGSSAFSDPLQEIVRQYRRACASASIDLQLAGSRAGMHDLSAVGAQSRGGLAVLNDGPDTTHPAIDLRSHPVAVVVYSVILSDTTGVTNLSLAQLRDIYRGRYHRWSELGGKDVPIRIVGRDGESGSRQIFQSKLLGRSEGAASSTECRESSPPLHAPTIRCELRTTGELIDKVAQTPGAVGYADAPTAKAEAARLQRFHVVTLDGRLPEATSIAQGYPFWTVEYLYTAGAPAGSSLLRNLIAFLGSANARAELSIRGYPPCIDRNGDRNPLCTQTP